MNNVSIIIPIYNTEKYLPRCLDSVLAQTYSDWEAVLVDDGSQDKSSVICEEYSAKDSRFKTYHKNNEGVSSARNLALDHFHGQYIMFIDSDDMLFPNALETMVKYMQDGIDSVCCTYVTTDEYDSLIAYSSTDHFGEVIERDKALSDFYIPSFGNCFNGYLWNRLFRTSIIKDNHLRFREDVHIKEDGLFLVQYLCRCKGKHYFSSEPVYKYRINDGSVMRNYSGFINSKSVSGVVGDIECYKEVADSTTNLNLLKLSRESIAMRYLYLSYSSFRAGQFVIKDICRLGKVVFQCVTIGDFFHAIWIILKTKLKR